MTGEAAALTLPLPLRERGWGCASPDGYAGEGAQPFSRFAGEGGRAQRGRMERHEIRAPHRDGRSRPYRGLVSRRRAHERVVAARPLRQRGPDGLFHARAYRRVAQHGAAEAACAASGRRRTLQARLRHRADVEAQPCLPWRDHARGDADRLRDRLGAGHRPRRSHRLHALARAIDDAVDRGLADRSDHRARADDRRHPQPVQHHRRRAEGGDRGLSVVLSGDRRHGEGLPLARSVAARSHAHLFGDATRRPS